jgi:hypothetical protein
MRRRNGRASEVAGIECADDGAEPIRKRCAFRALAIGSFQEQRDLNLRAESSMAAAILAENDVDERGTVADKEAIGRDKGVAARLVGHVEASRAHERLMHAETL